MSLEIATAPPRIPSRASVERLAQRRQEPDWLLALRLRALESFERLPLPDQRTEGWRRTSLRGLSLDWPDPSSSSVRLSIAPDQGVVVPLEAALHDLSLAALVEQHFGSVVPADLDKLTALHYAFFNAGVVICVPRGRAVADPIWITYDFDEPGQAAFVHCLLIVGDGAEVDVVEEYRGGSGLASGVVEQVVGSNAHVRYVQLQRFATDVWDFSTQRARLAQDASLRTLNVALGARMARNTVQVVLDGRGAQADVLGIVDGTGRQHVDFETLQDHIGDATRSDLVIHNALRGRSSANFTGLIRINTSAHHTESSQEQKNLLLSEHAKADSDPKLEILNNDVIRCTHGASVGPVDQEMIFYLESRGLDRVSSEQLIVDGFFQSTLGKLNRPALQEAVWTAIGEHQANREPVGE